MGFNQRTPTVIPSLREWSDYEGRFSLTTQTRLLMHENHAPRLNESARFLQQEILQRTGLSLPSELGTESAPGTIYLALGIEDDQVGDQGYLLAIEDQLTIKAADSPGIFYGGQTILQLLRSSPDGRSLPRGIARDYPHFTQRGLMIDTGRKYWQMAYLHDLMQRMAHLKLNILHLHLSDWNAFRVQSDLHPKLAAEEAYSKDDIAQLHAWANLYQITIIPEIDLPGHSTVFTRYDPALSFACESMSHGRWKGGENGGWAINYADPNARQWMKDLVAELIPMFPGPYFHIGTDEIPDGDSPGQCPELVNYAREHGFPHAGDVLVEWINEMNEFIASHGKQLQLWSWWERAPHSLSPDKDVIVNDWLDDCNPAIFLDDGYKVMHSPGNTHYLTPNLGLFPDEDFLYNNWELSSHPNSLGYKICVWADEAEDEPDEYFESPLRIPRAILAERTWNPEKPAKELPAFRQSLEELLSDG